MIVRRVTVTPLGDEDEKVELLEGASLQKLFDSPVVERTPLAVRVIHNHLPAQFKEKLHSHGRALDIVTVIAGSCTLITQKGRYELNVQDFVCIEPRAVHAFTTSEDSAQLWSIQLVTPS